MPHMPTYAHMSGGRTYGIETGPLTSGNSLYRAHGPSGKVIIGIMYKEGHGARKSV